jgi:uncharacterized membrane protein YraQ (UPF0718 family)
MRTIVVLWIVAGVGLLVSLAINRRKTRAAVIRGARMFGAILPSLAGMLAVASVVLAAVSPATLQRLLAGSGPVPFLAALGVGSIALVPGFIAYPLAGVLRQNGASISVLAAFLTSLMMVGVVTLPVEARYFGWRASLIRNGLAACGSAVVAAGMTWVLR